MQRLSIHRTASALLMMLVIFSIVIVLSGVGGNHYYYGVPLAGLLSYVIVISGLHAQMTWGRSITIAILIPCVFAASLYASAFYGWPYGPFHLSDMLGFEIVERTPWTYPVVWMLLLMTSLALTVRRPNVFRSPFAALFTRAFDTALMTTLVLLVMLPPMAASGLVSFQDGFAFEGVGIQFMVASFMISLVACALLISFMSGSRTNVSVSRSLTIALTALMLFWTLTSFLTSLYASAFVGVAMILWVNWKQQYANQH